VTNDGPAGIGNDHGLGHGLAGLAERVAVVRGELTAGPQPGGGYRVEATLPRRTPS
jgi:signal transduction histidine kinase